MCSPIACAHSTISRHIYLDFRLDTLRQLPAQNRPPSFSTPNPRRPAIFLTVKCTSRDEQVSGHSGGAAVAAVGGRSRVHCRAPARDRVRARALDRLPARACAWTQRDSKLDGARLSFSFLLNAAAHSLSSQFLLNIHQISL